jgi:hypothetical protein
MILRAACGVALTLISIAAAPPPVVEIRNANDPKNKIEARAEFDSGSIRLSGEIKLTLTVNGPGPLSVTVPKPLITQSNLWRVRDAGLPLREILSSGRERWTQAYALSPLTVGDPKLALGPLIVRAGDALDLTISWDEEKLPSIHVVTLIENPSAEALRPPTDIELLPPNPTVANGSTNWLFAIVPALLCLSGLAIVLGRRGKRPATPRDAAWAHQELNAATLSADRCALIVRKYLAFRCGVPAEFQTTLELTASLTAADCITNDAVAEWESLLDACDAARFSGTTPSGFGLADHAHRLVDLTEQMIQAGRDEARKVTKN